MGQAAEQVAVLQRFIDDVPRAAQAIHESVGRPGMPDDARRVLVGALNYMLDLLDIFPDHYKGLGLADDASVLRFAARLAVKAGADGEALTKLAREASELDRIFADLAEPFSKLVAQLPERNVRGRTAAQILGSKDVRAGFDADIQRAVARLQPSPIDTALGGPEGAIGELNKMVRAAVKKAGLG
jgi:uncharacterized membrane protein YkvA (DUF1232 family)